MSETFFISDLHFNHENIITFDHRPFRDHTHMYYSLIARWNNVVGPNDTVYILGDFHWSGEPKEVLKVLNKLNGNKRLIKGNHDRYTQSPLVKNAFAQYIKDYDEIEVDGRRVVLSHYPIASWKHMRGDGNAATIHLYGHVHMTDEFYLYEEYLDILHKKGIAAMAYNVGAMTPWMGYQPRTLDEIIQGYNLVKKGK